MAALAEIVFRADKTHQTCTFKDRTGKVLGDYSVALITHNPPGQPGAKTTLPLCADLGDGRMFTLVPTDDERIFVFQETPRPGVILKSIDGTTETVSVFQPSPRIVKKGAKFFRRMNEDLYVETTVEELT